MAPHDLAQGFVLEGIEPRGVAPGCGEEFPGFGFCRASGHFQGCGALGLKLRRLGSHACFRPGLLLGILLRQACFEGLTFFAEAPLYGQHLVEHGIWHAGLPMKDDSCLITV